VKLWERGRSHPRPVGGGLATVIYCPVREDPRWGRGLARWPPDDRDGAALERQGGGLQSVEH